MSDPLCQYFRCPDTFMPLSTHGTLSKRKGYFKFGNNILYGNISGRTPSHTANGHLVDVLHDSRIEDGRLCLPFDVGEVLNGLRYESYHLASNGHHPARSISGRAYYLLRPFLPVRVRKHLQRIRLNGWHQLTFPDWPVDCTVETTLQSLLLLSLKAADVCEIPFIWFWPEGASACAIMTHDVETSAGRDFCSSLMDINDRFGITASFQVVPERRYEVSASFLDSIRRRGCEVNVQDLNHDGRLFRDRKEFLARAAKINSYGRDFGAEGFRSAILYRRQEWYDALKFSYDMSVPNVAHLDPQRGGCCTVMPYFVGDMVELPVTMTQDYSLFHILQDYSIELWRRQIHLVMAKHGLMNFIVHPDYVIGQRERSIYETLLSYLSKLKAEEKVWMPLPREVSSWWRQRSQMKLVPTNNGWKIEGDGSERAQIAYATERDGNLVYSFTSCSTTAVDATCSCQSSGLQNP